ncbi:DUF2851 family protein [soil metagenome]
MKEKLLQFIWQFSYFNKGALTVSTGEYLQILHPGNINQGQGPDFLNAKICIGKTIWAGNIELHINASDWDLHKHSSDNNYKNIILHVVLNNDKPVENIPALELKDRISTMLLTRYDQLMQTNKIITCSDQINNVSSITLESWKDRLVIERLMQKAQGILIKAEKNNFHWEEVFWQVIARNFGITTNADAFELIANGLPLKILTKHKNHLFQIEAMLFGLAGLLNKQIDDEYSEKLRKEYAFLNQKYQLKQPALPVFFLRMRPDNFPTIRLAQLAMLVHKSLHLFSKILEEENINEVMKLLNVSASEYWNDHYKFSEVSKVKVKRTGKQMIRNIVINTVIPILFSYGIYHKRPSLKNKAVNWLEQLAEENNSVTKNFTDLNLSSKTAFCSQAFIQLKHEYCDKKRCLDCAIGNAILKRSYF